MQEQPKSLAEFNGLQGLCPPPMPLIEKKEYSNGTYFFNSLNPDMKFG